MAEAAQSAQAAAAPSAQPAAQPTAPSAPTLSSVPTGPDWANGFKNEEVKSFLTQNANRFKTTEDLATSFYNLEKMKGVPEDRLLKIPEKLDGPEARGIWERLGAPKDAKGYEIPRAESGDNSFVDNIEGIFHKNNLTKSQALGVVGAYNDLVTNQQKARAESTQNAILQADAKLKAEWGAQYDSNLNLAKQGAKILGLDPKTVDIIEATQGRDVLFKTLHKIGVSVGESSFVDGGTQNQSTAMTPEQAQQEINTLIKDQKFVKKVNRGEKEATEKWHALNKLAAPGEKSIG